jgi:hypothetical protein
MEAPCRFGSELTGFFIGGAILQNLKENWIILKGPSLTQSNLSKTKKL